ncbi:hypothetical protein F5X96DRAFT_644868 [Biscogniauxia mediterranea]|nr:hypothetical protein F5X96DRAFT_644868 [Biscogniauxia mediterranea]
MAFDRYIQAFFHLSIALLPISSYPIHPASQPQPIPPPFLYFPNPIEPISLPPPHTLPYPTHPPPPPPPPVA